MESEGEDIVGAERVVAVMDDVVEGYGCEDFLAICECCGGVDGACGDEIEECGFGVHLAEDHEFAFGWEVLETWNIDGLCCDDGVGEGIHWGLGC